MIAKEIAKMLLDIKAVTINVQKPFRYTSGILSPIYTDNRMIISYPEHRTKITEAFVKKIQKKNIQFDIIGGTSTAGIPYAAFLAEKLHAPMVYIRGAAKGHGKKKQVEGNMPEGSTVLVIEDLISTGGSSIESITGIRNEGGKANTTLAIFSYEMEKAEKSFSANNITVHTLTTFSTLMNVALTEGHITEEEKEKALEWNKDPQGWGKKWS